MNRRGPHFVILHPTHKPFTQSLINHKNNLGSYLRAQKDCLFHTDIRAASTASGVADTRAARGTTSSRCRWAALSIVSASDTIVPASKGIAGSATWCFPFGEVLWWL